MTAPAPTPTNGHPVPAPRPSDGGGAPGGGPTAYAGLPQLDPADVRFTDARRYFDQHAAEAELLANGLSHQEVDEQTLTLIRAKRDRDTALIRRINDMYSGVENAVNSAQHIAKRQAYQQR